LIPKFASELPQALASFGIGTLEYLARSFSPISLEKTHAQIGVHACSDDSDPFRGCIGMECQCGIHKRRCRACCRGPIREPDRGRGLRRQMGPLSARAVLGLRSARMLVPPLLIGSGANYEAARFKRLKSKEKAPAWFSRATGASLITALAGAQRYRMLFGPSPFDNCAAPNPSDCCISANK
jgi:hypothetical protein